MRKFALLAGSALLAMSVNTQVSAQDLPTCVQALTAGIPLPGNCRQILLENPTALPPGAVVPAAPAPAPGLSLDGGGGAAGGGNSGVTTVPPPASPA